MPRGGNTKSRVRWTPEECLMLANMAVSIRKTNPKTSYVVAVKEAQKSLPPPRHRFLNSRGAVTKIIPFIDKLEAKKEALWAPVREQMPEPEPTPKLSLEDQLVDIAAGFLEKVIREAIGRIGGEWADLLPKSPAPVHESLLPIITRKHNPEMVTAAKTILPSVLVCGLKPFQHPPILKALAGKLKLKFWYQASPNENMQMFKDKAASVDIVMFSLDATSHAATELAKSMGKKILKVSGASSTVIRALLSYADNHGE